MEKYILVIDEGTTGVRAILFNKDFSIVGQHYEKLQVDYRDGGIVEECADEIYDKTMICCRSVLKECGVDPEQLLTVGITTQRATWTLWDRKTGKTQHKMVTWQDSRSRDRISLVLGDERFQQICPEWAPAIRPLTITVALSGILDKNPELDKKMKAGELYFGTVDTWLVYKMTGGKVFATEPTNASIMIGMLKNGEAVYPENLLHDYLGYPMDAFPEMKNCADDFGVVEPSFWGEGVEALVPITGVIGDQQSSLFSQGCHEKNSGRVTNGTGSFFMVNLGDKLPEIPEGAAIPKVAWKIGNETNYSIEAICPTTGAVLEWMKANMGWLDDISKIDKIAASVPDNGGVYFVPALTGLHTPVLDMRARASYMGISGTTTKEHCVRATLESIGYVIGSCFEKLQREYGLDMEEVKASGGVSKSEMVGQMMANLLNMKVERPVSVEATALGAAQMAALYLGQITKEDVKKMIVSQKTFTPDANAEKCKEDYQVWKKAVSRSQEWLD